MRSPLPAPGFCRNSPIACISFVEMAQSGGQDGKRESSPIPELLGAGIVRIAFLFMIGTMWVAMNACSETGTNTQDRSSVEDLLGPVWNLDSLKAPDTTIVVSHITNTSIRFTDDGVVRGYVDAFHTYSGVYMLAGDNSDSVSIMELPEWQCRPSSMPCIFLVALEQVNRYDVQEGQLQLYSQGEYAIYFSPSYFDEELLEYDWQVDSLWTPDAWLARSRDSIVTIFYPSDTVDVPPKTGAVSITLSFNTFMQVEGYMFCNWYSGPIVLTKAGSFTSQYPVTTLRYCEYSIGWDFLFLGAMENAATYEIGGGRLVLTSQDGSYRMVSSIKERLAPQALIPPHSPP